MIYKKFKRLERGTLHYNISGQIWHFLRAEMEGHALWHNIKLQIKGRVFPRFDVALHCCLNFSASLSASLRLGRRQRLSSVTYEIGQAEDKPTRPESLHAPDSGHSGPTWRAACGSKCGGIGRSNPIGGAPDVLLNLEHLIIDEHLCSSAHVAAFLSQEKKQQIKIETVLKPNSAPLFFRLLSFFN